MADELDFDRARVLQAVWQRTWQEPAADAAPFALPQD